MLIGILLFLSIMGVFGFKISQSYAIAKKEVDDEYDNIKSGLAEVLPTIPFFNLLNKKEQREFLHRTVYFKRNIKYHAQDSLVLTNQMTTLFAALCTKITFGFDDFKLETLKHVFFYKDSFYSIALEQEVTGLTTENGMVFLSWEETQEGVAAPYSKRNLGLHELAHILEIEAKKTSTSWNMNNWYKVADKEIEIIKHSDSGGLFRAYGLTNVHECWAVSIEYFFEQPHEFKVNFPHLFLATQIVLNQTIPLRMKA
jgi:Mlc titration factor MtfA (ptsG expression regulator)